MKLFAVIYFAICLLACGQSHEPAVPAEQKDTALAAVDTVYNPYTDKERIADSLQAVRERDSFYAVKPIHVFKTDTGGDSFLKMVAAYIDTNGVTVTPLNLTDTTIVKYNDKQDGYIYIRDILKGKRFVLEVLYTNEDDPRKLFINGKEMRPGIELDTSLAGDYFVNSLALGDAALMKFGAKEYLFIRGYIHNCNGMGCGVSYYILYDPAIKKAVAITQFRQDFIPGFDKKGNTPVFMYMDEDAGFNDQFNCFIYSGNVFRIGQNLKVKKLSDKNGLPLFYYAYYPGDGDSIIFMKGNPPNQLN